MALLLNFAAFQVGWFSAVIGAAHGLPWAGVLVIAAVIALHLWMARRPSRELSLILLCGLVGACLDSVLVAAGWVSYASGYVVGTAAPYWIVAMWMLFATTLNVSMNWLKRRPFIACVLGAAGGPLAYWTGSELGGIVFREPVAALAALGVGWAVVMPLLMVLAERFDGVSVSADHARLAEEGRGL